MNKKVVLSCAALVVAGILLYSHWRDRHPLPGETYFYDLSEEKLFAGPLVALPPIQGINDIERDAVRALVISPSGDPSDKSGRKIAYLETYSEIFKQQVESRRRGDVPAEGAGRSDAAQLTRTPSSVASRKQNGIRRPPPRRPRSSGNGE